MAGEDHYSTVKTTVQEVLFKDRKSKFLGYVFPITSVTEVKPILESISRKHANANHVCYAWRLGINPYEFRANDDGEPKNSAGMPIYGQILSFDITNVLVAVVRFFGGTKLGVGGLIQAYRTTAKLTLENSEIIVKRVEVHFAIDFDYPDMEKVMRSLKQKKIMILSQHMELKCSVHIAVPQSEAGQIQILFELMRGVTVRRMN